VGKIDKLKSRLGFGAGWDDEYLQEDEAEAEEISPSGAKMEFPINSHDSATATGMARGTGSPDVYGSGVRDRLSELGSPYASGAAPSAVTKHVRKPDLQRASQASGSVLRDVAESAPPVQGQQDDGVYYARPKHFSEVSDIADQFRAGVPVSMDLTLVSIQQRQRFIDFVAGLVYALDGHLARSSNQVYVLTPRT